MREKLTRLYNVLDALKVDGWENFERLVYAKLIIEQLIKDAKPEDKEE